MRSCKALIKTRNHVLERLFDNDIIVEQIFFVNTFLNICSDRANGANALKNQYFSIVEEIDEQKRTNFILFFFYKMLYVIFLLVNQFALFGYFSELFLSPVPFSTTANIFLWNITPRTKRITAITAITIAAV